VIAKLMGLLVAPFAFCGIICGILLLFAQATVGDIIGYGSVLLLKEPPSTNYDVVDFLEPAKPGEGTADTINITEVTFPTYGSVYGEISIPEADILCPLIFGDSRDLLTRGACQYIGSPIIGYGGTSMISAHISRHFKNLHKVEVGDEIQIRTSYGIYTYEVKYVGIHRATDDSAYDIGREDENIVLYTCHLGTASVGNIKDRFFVCADYVSGPMIVDWGGAQ